MIRWCKARKLPGDQCQRLADIALETALTESGLRMYANAHNPESLRLPHDAVGSDHGSVGLFQQQVGGAVNSTANWGTTAELMNPEISTRKFLDALLRLNWIPMTNWAAAQAVQHSAFPDGSNYRSNDARSITIRNTLWGSTAAGSKPVQPASPGHPAQPIHLVAPGDTLFSIARAWGVTLQAVETANPNAGHPPGNFNVIRPGDQIVHPQRLEIALARRSPIRFRACVYRGGSAAGAAGAAAVIEHAFDGDREPFRQQLIAAIAADRGRPYWESWTAALEAWYRPCPTSPDPDDNRPDPLWPGRLNPPLGRLTGRAGVVVIHTDQGDPQRAADCALPAVLVAEALDRTVVTPAPERSLWEPARSDCGRRLHLEVDRRRTGVTLPRPLGVNTRA